MPPSKYRADENRTRKALCLSGGGYRATLFHLGAMRRLNELGLLSRLDTISSVSGGSIANGLLARVWPALQTGLDAKTGVFGSFEAVYEAPLRAFCHRNIRTAPLLLDRLNPLHWMSLWSDDHSATDSLANAYRDHLVQDLRLKDLAGIRARGGPRFVFDASNLQTGVNFEFSGDRIERGQVVDLQVGDYEIGHGKAPDLLVAEAVAASSAFPIAFPPLVLKFDPGTFSGGKLAEPPADPALDQMQRRVVLSDGGVYDNLGLEPVWKSHGVILCSDGGKPFATSAAPGSSAVPRLLRCQDVIGNQAIAVRKRWLVHSFEQHEYQGGYWGIASEIEGYPKHQRGYGGVVLERLRKVRTDLDDFIDDEQLVLMNHGWLLADAAIRSFVWDPGAPEPPRGVVPSERLLDEAAALRALAESDRIEPLGRS
jgi:NTE family protein